MVTHPWSKGARHGPVNHGQTDRVLAISGQMNGGLPCHGGYVAQDG